MKTTNYICKTCKKEFSKESVCESSMGTEKPSAYLKTNVCPHCGSCSYKQKEIVTKEQLRQYVFLKRELKKEEDKLLLLDKSNRRYAAVYEKIENNRLRCLALYMRLQSYIYSIDDSLTRQIFELRYVEGLDWKGVSAQLGGFFSPDYVRILHDRYLKKQGG